MLDGKNQPKEFVPLQEIKVVYNDRSINNIFSAHTISPVFSMRLNHPFTFIGLSLLTYSGSESIAHMEQNPPHEEATDITPSRADLFGLKVLRKRQL